MNGLDAMTDLLYGPGQHMAGSDTSNEDAMTQVAPTVEVIGGVAKPGKTFYRQDANLFYYLGKRGGVIPNLGYDEAFVIRKGANGLERINFNITKNKSQHRYKLLIKDYNAYFERLCFQLL